MYHVKIARDLVAELNLAILGKNYDYLSEKTDWERGKKIGR